MHRVVALLAPGIAPFELGIVVEVFGLARPELDAPWWYELTVAAERPGPVPATAPDQAGTAGQTSEHDGDPAETDRPSWKPGRGATTKKGNPRKAPKGGTDRMRP